MLHRPLAIITMTLFLGVMLPILAILWTVFHETPYWENFDPFAAVMGLLGTIIGYGLWKVKPWALYAYYVMSCFIVGALVMQFAVAPNLEDGLVLFGVAIFIIGSCLVVQKHIHSPYFNPRFQWGRRDTRHRVNAEVTFEIDQKLCRGWLIDISRNGCFVDLETHYQVGQKILLGIEVFNVNFKVNAQIVRSCDNPKGFGIMFFGVTKDLRKKIDSIIAEVLLTSASESYKKAQ